MLRKDTFSQPDFDTTVWINAALAEREDEPLEAYLAACNLKIHMLSQECNEQLDYHMQDIAASVPRISSEVSRVEDLLRTLESEMGRLAVQLAGFDERNASGVEDLVRLDVLKGNLERCKDVLEQHHRWNELLAESRQFIEGGGKLVESADRLELMNKSLQVLVKMPGHEERQATCVKLREDLLAAFLPKIRKALLATDLSPLLDYVYVYSKIGLLADFETEYVTGRSALFVAEWDAEFKPASAIASEAVPSKLGAFFSHVQRLALDEGAKMREIFGEKHVIPLLSRMLTLVFQTRRAAMVEAMSAITSPLVMLEAYAATEAFIDELAVRLDGKGSASAFADLVEAVLHPLDDAHLQYVRLEERHLHAAIGHALASVVFAYDPAEARDRQDSYESLYGVYVQFGDGLVSCCDEVCLALQEALVRGVRFLTGLCAKHLVDTLSTQLGAFVKKMSVRVLDLRVALGLFSRHHEGFASPTKRGGAEDGEDARNLAVAEALARRLRSQDRHVLDDRMLVPVALRSLQFIGRLNANVDALNADADGLLHGLFSSLIAGRGKPVEHAHSIVGCLALMEKNQERAAHLRSFLSLYAKPPVVPAARSAAPAFVVVSSVLKKIRGAAGALVMDLSTAASQHLAQGLSEEPVWAKEMDVRSLQDSALPQQTVTHIGEHVLSVAQEIEAFCTSVAQPDMVAAAGDAALFATSGWHQLRTILGVKEEESLNGLCLRNSCRAVVLAAEISMFGSPLAGSAEYGEGEEVLYDDALVPQGSEEEAVQRFVNAWLIAVLDNTFGLILCQICRIKKLSAAGRVQLEADLGYLRNVVTALGAVPHPLLIHLSLIIYKEPALLTTCVNAMLIQSPISALLNKIDSVVAGALMLGQGESGAVEGEAKI